MDIHQRFPSPLRVWRKSFVDFQLQNREYFVLHRVRLFARGKKLLARSTLWNERCGRIGERDGRVLLRDEGRASSPVSKLADDFVALDVGFFCCPFQESLNLRRTEKDGRRRKKLSGQVARRLKYEGTSNTCWRGCWLVIVWWRMGWWLGSCSTTAKSISCCPATRYLGSCSTRPSAATTTASTTAPKASKFTKLDKQSWLLWLHPGVAGWACRAKFWASRLGFCMLPILRTSQHPLCSIPVFQEILSRSTNAAYLQAACWYDNFSMLINHLM